MSINKISGNILADNLVRGANLAIQGNLIYFDIVSSKIGVLTNTPTQDFTVNGNIGVGSNLVISDDSIASSANLTLSSSANLNLTSSANILLTTPNGNVIASNVSVQNLDSSNTITAVGNATIGNVNTAGIINAAGNVIGGNLTTVGMVDAAGNVIGGNLTTVGMVDAAGNVIGGNLTTPGMLSAVGNANAGNLNTVGVFSTTIDSTGNATVGNLSTAGTVVATGNVQGGNLTTGGALSVTGNANIGNIGSSGIITTPGDVVAGNLISTGILSVIGTADISNVTIIGNSISATAGKLDLGSNADIQITGGNPDYVLATDGSGNLFWTNLENSLGNLFFSNTTITTDGTIGNITLQPTGNGLLIINTTTGVVVPTGNTSQRPVSPPTGTTRFNTSTSSIEVWDGAEWDTITGGVTNQILYGDNSSSTFGLNRTPTSTAGVLVAINGVLQIPGMAYSVTGNQITFSQAPVTSDIIDIRFL